MVVWRRSMDLVEEIYRIVKQLPQEENYALSEQMRRAVISIPSTIAEGHGRGSVREFSRFLLIAQGSRAELETQIEICIRLHYISEEQAKNALSFCGEIGKMLRILTQKLLQTTN